MSPKAWAFIIILIIVLIYDPKIINEIVNAIVNLLNSSPKGG